MDSGNRKWEQVYRVELATMIGAGGLTLKVEGFVMLDYWMHEILLLAII